MADPCVACNHRGALNQFLQQSCPFTDRKDSPHQDPEACFILQNFKCGKKGFEYLSEAVFESSQDCIIVVDKNYKHLYINQEALNKVDITAGKEAGNTIYDTLGHLPEMMEKWKSRIDGVFKTGKPLQVQDEGLVGDRYVFSDAILSPVCYPSGKLFAVSIVVRDVTHLKTLEKELQTSRDWYKRLAEATFDGIIIHDSSCIIQVNQQFADIFGYTLEELFKINRMNLFAPESRDMAKKKIAEGFEGSYEAVGLKKDGTQFPIEVRAKHSQLGDRQVRVAMCRDLSEQKEAEKKIEESESKYRELYKNARAALFRTRISDGILLDCSRATARMFGYSNEAEYKDNFSALDTYVNPQQRELLIKTLEKNKRVHGFEIELQRKDGSSIWVAISAELFPERDYLEGAMQDITVNKTLTKAEKKVLDLLMRGFSNKEIAFKTGRSVRTIEDHRSHIMQKLKVDNIVELTQKALKLPEFHTK